VDYTKLLAAFTPGEDPLVAKVRKFVADTKGADKKLKVGPPEEHSLFARLEVRQAGRGELSSRSGKQGGEH
jgi:hypothetical protein